MQACRPSERPRRLGAVYSRIDSIEQAIRDSVAGSLRLDDAGYRVAYALADDNLRLGRTVIADSVNPIGLTRDAWLSVADRAQVTAVTAREYHPWERDHIIVDTAGRSIEQSIQTLQAALPRP